LQIFDFRSWPWAQLADAASNLKSSIWSPQSIWNDS
jgi:hypothetical protein